MKERLDKLLEIKSIVTIITTCVVSYLAIIGALAPEQYLTIFTMIIGFYFGTKSKNVE